MAPIAIEEILIDALLPAIPVFAKTELLAATLAETILLVLRFDSLVSLGVEGNVTVNVEVFDTVAIV